MRSKFRNNKLRSVSLFICMVLPCLSAFTQADVDRAVAARFAPVFYQALGESPRSDYITKFDFDGDWRGDNNWENAADRKFPLRAYIYYAVSETKTHYFIHYAVFHPRDYKGGEQKGRLFSDLIREGAKILGDRDPSGMLNDATIAHENDMEGALVVVEKKGENFAAARVRFVETLAHNAFLRYAPESAATAVGTFKAEDERVSLYIEPRGHGIEAYSDAKQTDGKKTLIYKFTGKADDPENLTSESVGYDLLPIHTTLWPKALAATAKKGPTYGKINDYALIEINLAQANGRITARKIKIGAIGSSFFGTEGGENMARPPWGWFDRDRRTDALGLWFFDPATIIKRDFNLGETFSTAYIRLPFWGREKL